MCPNPNSVVSQRCTDSPHLLGENYSAVELLEAASSGFNERIDVSGTYPTGTPEVFNRGGLGLFSTIGDYMSIAQMLAENGTHDGQRIIGRKTLELMHSNHFPANLLPWELLDWRATGAGFGLGSLVILDPARTAGTGSVVECDRPGAATTYYWVDPSVELVGIFMSPYITGGPVART